MKHRIISTEELFGCKPEEFAILRYKEAIQYKLKKAKERLHSLVHVHYSVRDDYLINKVMKAIAINELLLKELDK